MTLAEYMVRMMQAHKDLWHTDKDSNGVTVLVNSKGYFCRGIKEEDGTIVSTDELLAMYNKAEA